MVATLEDRINVLEWKVSGLEADADVEIKSREDEQEESRGQGQVFCQRRVLIQVIASCTTSK